MAVALFLAGCGAQPNPTATPTSVVTATRLTAPVATPSETPAPSATAEPTATSTATVTPLPTWTFTPIVLFFSPTASNTPIGPLDCSLTMQSIENGHEVSPGERFTMGWQVTNTGSATWYPGTVLFSYIGGSKLALYPETQLQLSVPPGGTTTLSVEMKAPKNSTLYTTFWSLRQGKTYFCRVRLSIYVK
jgi:hypothetical protein